MTNILKGASGDLYKTFKPGIIAAVIGIILLIIFIPIGTYIAFAKDLGSKESIMNRNDAGITLLDRNEKPFFTFYQAKQKKIIPLTEIPKQMQQSVIASEDKDFYNHPGFSIRGIARSFVANLHQGELAQGGSTLTQQLVKNALLNPQKNFLRKYQEVVLASEIERRYKKNEILEMYLNSVYFGEGAFGIEQAAETYYDKPASQLTLAESALLTGLLTAPSALSPLSNDPQKAYKKQKIVLDEMVEQKYITKNEEEQALKQKIVFNTNKEELNLVAPHFALMVKDELIQKYGEEQVARSGFKVQTTLNLEWQEYAERVVKNQVSALRSSDVSNGAAVAIEAKTGEVVVLVGSADWYDKENGKVNMVLRKRQPGSSFKPIVYGAAIEEKIITPGTILHDKPTTFPGNYKPENYDRQYRGDLLPRRALANSLNIPAVEVMQMLGVDQAIDTAERLGITALTDRSNYGLSLVLGAGEVPLIEMANAFGTFARAGEYIAPTTILSITDKSGKKIYEYTPESKQVFDPGAAYIISSILSDNAARGEVFGNALTISRPAAVKTGTTEDYRDSLTIGYTPSMVVGVWVGNNDNTPMNQVAGSLGAAPIWRSIMEHTLVGTPIEKFSPPPGLDSANICKEKGLLVKESTSSAQLEYFLKGTEPTQLCFDISPTSIPSPSPDISITDRPTAPPSPTNNPTESPKPSDTPRPTKEIKVPAIFDTPTPSPSVQPSQTPNP